MTPKVHSRATYGAVCPFRCLKTGTVRDRAKDKRTLPSLMFKAAVEGHVWRTMSASHAPSFVFSWTIVVALPAKGKRPRSL